MKVILSGIRWAMTSYVGFDISTESSEEVEHAKLWRGAAFGYEIDIEAGC
jgi:hypothetical protein